MDRGNGSWKKQWQSRCGSRTAIGFTMKKALTAVYRKGFDFMEPLSRIELETSSLPRMRSTN